MKTIFIKSLSGLFFLAFLINGNAQKKFYTTMTLSFDKYSEGLVAIGNTCTNKDVVITHDSVAGAVNVVVNKVCNQWSYVQHWMSGYAPGIVFKERYLEMRVKSSKVQTTGCNIKITYRTDVVSEPLEYTITRANVWETKFFRLEGTEDTVFNQIAYNFANGTYKIDYILYGDTAVPPVPVIDQVSDTSINDNGGVYSIDLTGIEIPGRFYDGLKIKAEPKTHLFFQNVSLKKFSGDTIINESTKTATLEFSLRQGTIFNSDSIIITLDDTIRGTNKRMAFRVTNLSCAGQCFDASSENAQLEIDVYPTRATKGINIVLSEPFTGDINIVDVLGNTILTDKVHSSQSVVVNLESLSNGIYLLKLSGKTGFAIRKFIKE